MAQDTALVIDHVAIAAADPHGLLITRLNPSVRALDTAWVSATGIAGQHVWMSGASLVVSGMAASIAAS